MLWFAICCSTGQSCNATKAHSVGKGSQVVAEGKTAVRHERGLRPRSFPKIGPNDGYRREALHKSPVRKKNCGQKIEIFCDMFMHPAVEAGLRKFVESEDALPYLP